MIEEKVLSEYEKVSGERMTKDVESKNND